METRSALYPALLRYFRNRRGMSQLDLALNAGVSARHISFLETGRAQPSREMVLLLANTLRVPLRDRNTMLTASGYQPAYAEPALDAGLSPTVRDVIERMLKQHEPFPMAVMNQRYDIMRMNEGGTRVLSRFIAEPSAITQPINAFHLLFNPELSRAFVVDWPRTARELLSRLHVEALERPNHVPLRQLIDELLAYPDVPASFRHPDFSTPIESTFTLRLERGGSALGFITTLTVFSAPGNVTLEELRIESYFPLDPETERVCRQAEPGAERD